MDAEVELKINNDIKEVDERRHKRIDLDATAKQTARNPVHTPVGLTTTDDERRERERNH